MGTVASRGFAARRCPPSASRCWRRSLACGVGLLSLPLGLLELHRRSLQVALKKVVGKESMKDKVDSCLPSFATMRAPFLLKVLLNALLVALVLTVLLMKSRSQSLFLPPLLVVIEPLFAPLALPLLAGRTHGLEAKIPGQRWLPEVPKNAAPV